MDKILIKGPSLSYFSKFIEKYFPGRYDEWFNDLPEESKKIYSQIILPSKWYDLNSGNIDSLKSLAKVFYQNDAEKVAYEMGKYSGNIALNTVYKIFIKIPSIDFIIKKVAVITSTYYSTPVKISVTKNTKENITLSIKGFNVGQELMFPNISGWLDNLCSIILKGNYKIAFQFETVEDKLEGKIDIIID